ncbi:disrupted in schizophrenia 1 protein isoform X3 [Scleropages formosus]|uniref:disrupted in schizophrenia 1 protein isoform X3 n=1 Tax=Scleropages formosus TaxID=113540 RepID=UPI0010FAB46F|nr:disrupted in schizophrenia 1 protein isoform X3 [Scleropages formosus]
MKAGAPAAVPVGLSSRRRLPRRPGYMRADLLGTLQSTAQEDGQRSTLTNGEASCPLIDNPMDKSQHGPPASGPGCVSLQLNPVIPTFVPPAGGSRDGSFLQGRDLSFTLSQQPSRLNVADPTLRDSSGLRSKPRFDPGTHVAPLSPNQHSAKRDRFNSSFSFIRLSLNSAQGMDGSTGSPEQSEDRPVSPGKWGPVFVPSGQLEPACPSLKPGLAHSTDSSSLPVSPEVERSICPEPWREPPAGPADRRDALPDADSCSLDAEASSSLSVDSSDAASGSSVTSGYESATPCSDRAWEALAKKYESVLQDSLQSNRTNAKIESMMLKLQRLQQKAVLEDDYDTAEHFGNKLEELRRERGSLTLGLPSRHPTVERFLGRLRVRVRSAMQGAAGHRGEGAGCPGEGGGASHLEVLQRPLLRREQLRKEKQLVEDEMRELQRRLAELRERNAQLDRDLEQEEYLLEGEEDEGPALSGCSPTQLHELSRALEDTVTSQHRAQICTNLPLPVLRLQERERTLNTSIKEATAKVVMSQRLGGSLRRKVSESETQLLALHEAKIAAISGNDFSSAKELKAEMKCAYGERERLEGLLKRLQVLSAGNSRELAHMKEEQLLVKQELARREVQFEKTLRENVEKYVELLEDRLHSCGNLAVERVWEADLEACHLLLRGLRLRSPGCCGPEAEEEEEPPGAEPQTPSPPCVQQTPDCAMLTALGGRWCPETDLQHSEFTKKLEEFLFCMEDNQPEDTYSNSTDITEQCESISMKLQSLEERLQAAMLSHDRALAQSLQEEVLDVKTTLQAMLEQLNQEDDNEKRQEEMAEVHNEGNDEDPYFSDSWEI